MSVDVAAALMACMNLRCMQVLKFWLQHLHRLAAALPQTLLRHWTKFAHQARQWMFEAHERYTTLLVILSELLAVQVSKKCQPFLYSELADA